MTTETAPTVDALSMVPFADLARRDAEAGNAPWWLSAAILDCLVVRGSRNGRLLRSVPTNKGATTVGVWRSLMSSVAWNRAGMWSVMTRRDDHPERTAFLAAEAWQKRVLLLPKSGEVHLSTLVAVIGGGDGLNLASLHLDPELANMLVRYAPHSVLAPQQLKETAA